MQERWNKTVTTLSNYKLERQKTPYLHVGTPFQIRFRLRCMLGTDCLNYTLNRFGRGSNTPFCPKCDDKPETVDHFLCKCTIYSAIRIKLYRKFSQVYPQRERPFNHIGLLREPTTSRTIQRHKSVIIALNEFITEAWRRRLDYIHNKSLRAPN